MREELGDSASAAHGDPTAIRVNAYPPKVAQIHERIGCLDAPVPGMARADNADSPVSVLVQDAQHVLFIPGQVSLAWAEANVAAEVADVRYAPRLHR